MHVNQAIAKFNRVGRKKYLKKKKEESEFYNELLKQCLEDINESIEDGEKACGLYIAYDVVVGALESLGYTVSFTGLCNTFRVSGWAEVDE